MNNIIELTFDKTITNLAGNRYGNEVFVKQIEDNIDNTRLNVVIFPKQIEDIASSFIEGIYKNIGEKYGKTKAIEIMVLEARDEYAQEKINKSQETFGV